MEKPVNFVLIPIFVFIMLSISTTYTKTNKSIEVFKFIYIFALGLVLRIADLINPTPDDVFWFMKGSVDSIIKGINPYILTFPVYNNCCIHSAVLAYFPFTVFFFIPFQIFFNDLRYGIIFAELGISVLLYLIVRTKNEDLARASSAFYLLFTFFLNNFSIDILNFYIFNGNTEPIWVLLLLISCYLYMRNMKPLSFIVIGLAMATKPFAILFFIPFVILLIKNQELSTLRKSALIIISIATTTVIIAPFLFLSPHQFLSQTILFFSKFPPNPELGYPQWNMTLFPQLNFWGLGIALSVIRITQIISILSILVYFRNKITNIWDAVKVFTFLWFVLIIFNNFTQFYYWLSIIPFLIVAYVGSYVKQVNSIKSTSD